MLANASRSAAVNPLDPIPHRFAGEAHEALGDKPADDRGHGPHPEAIAACKDKSEGDACEFDAPHGHVAGTCHKDHAGDLACFHPHMHHDGGA